ncbi:PH domain-containing protein [Bacillus aquiflavi]|uniref:PH domain-containing protein n=1 Tax=Bacillus aquiflavi TaxID=2672567 RepID=A0A6B3W027_9BACI|nr:PH domain-containing protein [Bacillus aquiflavi]MBA4536839.1 PH domain-containing protein [Bacillus aquiflavi]NEY81206.1 PH domain-containing protein [Bacillus aquiflavi]UAC48483.1 PH domain-containing protein [Bacillus aquiflavi]
MLSEPQKRISVKALTVWRIYGIISSVIFLLLVGALIVYTIIAEWPYWYAAAAAVLLIVEAYITISIVPSVRWKRWRYEVREEEIELQRGIIVVKRTLIPMVRVQHVDTKQGPILKKYGLATITIATAASVHEIPALVEKEAEELRVSISKLARVANEDV